VRSEYISLCDNHLFQRKLNCLLTRCESLANTSLNVLVPCDEEHAQNAKPRRRELAQGLHPALGLFQRTQQDRHSTDVHVTARDEGMTRSPGPMLVPRSPAASPRIAAARFAATLGVPSLVTLCIAMTMNVPTNAPTAVPNCDIIAWRLVNPERTRML